MSSRCRELWAKRGSNRGDSHSTVTPEWNAQLVKTGDGWTHTVYFWRSSGKFYEAGCITSVKRTLPWPTRWRHQSLWRPGGVDSRRGKSLGNENRMRKKVLLLSRTERESQARKLESIKSLIQYLSDQC